MALIQARATVTLVGLGPGQVAWVDPDDPQIDRWLRGRQLIPVAEAQVASTSEPQVGVEAQPAKLKSRSSKSPAKKTE